ncbi:phosphomannomutase [Limimaricola hongkongensis]|uniref:Phosphomannomutase n=1 Tax=Limimaricola hongkongensis DSM 17492 TaxID=1122180 RepID=A0A017H7W5_9RHOB|nr:phosphomannomutase [Limimaricola hongkongensis]EYD70400.1 Phosphomannomutase [Limimaricola hongkongensis DSM 17492]
MPPKFGTSGLRGLVTDLSDDLVHGYVRAFIAACPHGGAVHVGRDLRDSSPRIAATVIAAVRGAGLRAVDCGAVPTPALAMAAMARGHAAVMVTGSHIPADRNGLKFYLPSGEIAKPDETAILAARDAGGAPDAPQGAFERDEACAARYVARYAEAFGPRALAGLRIGVFEHSSVARDTLAEVIAALGGDVVRIARSDRFIPVDTEAVDPDMRAALAGWAAAHRLDAIVSTDGDADRPMVTDAHGAMIPGDLLGPLTARHLGARVVVTPVSSNTLVEAMEGFALRRTRIGSPFVIAGMEAALQEDARARVIGYEANGGFLLGFAAQGPEGKIAPLMTRDAVLPIVAPLAAARAKGVGLAELAARLPPRFTAADRLQGVASERSMALIDALRADPQARAAFFDTGSAETGIDETDGLRVSFADGAVVHLRPSGNAPECRLYTEADSAGRAQDLLARHLERLAARLSAA